MENTNNHKSLDFTFTNIEKYGHEQVLYCSHKTTNFKAIIAIHSTVLGPALGGVRILNYANEGDALIDVLKLSRGMTYKNSLAGLDLGGGKAVILGEPQTVKNDVNFKQFSKFVTSLGGNYITAPDVNTDIYDMEIISKYTKYVCGLPTTCGGSGDPSMSTAYGTYLGMKAATKILFSNDSLENKKIAVQGVGKVGAYLVGMLCKEGAKVYVTDISKEKLFDIVKSHKVEVVQPDLIYNLPLDIYSPCALGGTLNDQTIPKLKSKIVAGAANNQLEDYSVHGQQLFDKDIMYVPDFLINAGGAINVSSEINGKYDPRSALKKVEEVIYETCLKLINRSLKEKTCTHAIAEKMAEERISKNCGQSF